MSAKLVLVRGLPGSGKSTLAREMIASGTAEAATLALWSGKTVVVSNTFTKLWEMQPYLDAAKTLGASVQIVVDRKSVV